MESQIQDGYSCNVGITRGLELKSWATGKHPPYR